MNEDCKTACAGFIFNISFSVRRDVVPPVCNKRHYHPELVDPGYERVHNTPLISGVSKCEKLETFSSTHLQQETELFRGFYRRFKKRPNSPKTMQHSF